MDNFKPKKSRTESSDSEEKSIEILERILRENSKDTKTNISKNDKTANYDGYIELLSDSIICGKITVQVKTLPSKYKNSPKFECPTPLFGYAIKCPTEIFIIIVVDHNTENIYWKHVNRHLIEKYSEKSNQKTITISFDSQETITKFNVKETIIQWKKKYYEIAKLIELEPNRDKNTQKLKYDNTISLSKENTAIIQRYISIVNDLLEKEFPIVKTYYFPNSWKVGFSFSTFEKNKLVFAFYNVEYGENDVLIKQISNSNIFENYTFGFWEAGNHILDSPYKHAKKFMVDYSSKILSKKLLLLSDVTGIEFIFDFIEKYGHLVEVEKKSNQYNVLEINKILDNKYAGLEKTPILIKTFYTTIKYLTNKGYLNIVKPYPENIFLWKGTNVKTAEKNAYKKLKTFYTHVIRLLEINTISYFPSLINKISLFKGHQVLVVNISNKGILGDFHDFRIRLYYFEIEGIKKESLIISKNFECDLFKKNEIKSENELTNRCFKEGESLQFNNHILNLKSIENEYSNSFREENYINNEICAILKNRLIELQK